MKDNTRECIAWMDRMIEKTGLCGVVLTECLARIADEEGHDSPSDNAMVIAREWDSNPDKVMSAIKESDDWCMKPTVGCRMNCKIWRRFCEVEP